MSRRIAGGRRPKRPKCCAAIWPSRCCNSWRWEKATSFPGSIRRRQTPSRTRGNCLTLIGATDDQGQITPLGRELARLPAHPRLGRLLLAGAEHGVLRETSIAAALLSERDPFRSAEHARRGPREYGTVRSRSDVVDRVLALAGILCGRRCRTIRLWSCIRAALAMCFGQPTNFFTLPILRGPRGRSDPTWL